MLGMKTIVSETNSAWKSVHEKTDSAWKNLRDKTEVREKTKVREKKKVAGGAWKNVECVKFVMQSKSAPWKRVWNYVRDTVF